MRNIKFNRLSGRNFLSIGDEPVIVDFNEGINIITGKNYDKDCVNGAGKSTIVEIIYFTLFGTTIRELNKDLIVNSINKKHCETMLEFSVTTTTETTYYKLTRQIAPSKCSLGKKLKIEDEYEDATKSTIAKTTEFVQKLLNSTGKVFQNSVIMTINDTKPFMAQEKVEKRKFIENILNLEVFSVMLVKAREEYNDLRRSYELLFTKKESLSKSHASNKQQLEMFEGSKQKRIDDIEQKILSTKNNIESLNKTFAIIPDNVDSILKESELKCNEDINSLNEEYLQISNKVTEIKSEIRNVEYQIKEVESLIREIESQIKDIEKVGSGCPTCKRAYAEEDNDHRDKCKEEFQNKIQGLRSKIVKSKVNIENFKIQEKDIIATGNPINEKKIEIKNKIEAIKTKRENLQSLKSSNDRIQSKIDYSEESIKTYKGDKIKIEKETNIFLEKDIKENTIILEQQIKELLEMDKSLQILDCVKFVISEEGVKSFIVKKILSILNQRLQYYLQKFEAPCFCVFNELFEEEMVDERKEKKSYYSFSAGERKRIDLSCLFAFLDIRRLQGDVTFSHTFYDELIDSSIDTRGIELVLDVLRDRVDDYEESAYIITHRGQAVSDRVDNVICIEKRNGFSNIITK